MSTWSKLEELNEHIRSRLRSKEINEIINADYNLNFGAADNEQQDNDNKPALPQSVSDLRLTQVDLDEIGLELEKAQVFLNSFRGQLVDLFGRGATAAAAEIVQQIAQQPPYNRLQLTMDKFKFELNYLRSYASCPSTAAAAGGGPFKSHHQQDENTRLLIDLDNNQISYKSHSTQRQQSTNTTAVKNDYSNDILTNIHLDFQVFIYD